MAGHLLHNLHSSLRKINKKNQSNANCTGLACQVEADNAHMQTQIYLLTYMHHTQGCSTCKDFVEGHPNDNFPTDSFKSMIEFPETGKTYLTTFPDTESTSGIHLLQGATPGPRKQTSAGQGLIYIAVIRAWNC